MKCDFCENEGCSWEKHNLKWTIVPFSKPSKQERGCQFLQTYRVGYDEHGYYLTKAFNDGWFVTTFSLPGVKDVNNELLFNQLKNDGYKTKPFFEGEVIFFDVEGWQL